MLDLLGEFDLREGTAARTANGYLVADHDLCPAAEPAGYRCHWKDWNLCDDGLPDKFVWHSTRVMRMRCACSRDQHQLAVA